MMPHSRCHHRPFFPPKSTQSSSQARRALGGKAVGWRRGIIPIRELSRLPPREAGRLLSVGLVGGHCTAEAVPAAGQARLRDGTHVRGVQRDPDGWGRQRNAWGVRGFGGCFGLVIPGKGLLQVPPTTHKPPCQGPLKPDRCTDTSLRDRWTPTPSLPALPTRVLPTHVHRAQRAQLGGPCSPLALTSVETQG